MDPDEGRYAEIGREILALKDWLIPHLNALPYLEKPPLVYWLTALSFSGLGLTETAARLPAALSALAGVYLTYFLGRALFSPGAGFLAAVVLATFPGYVVLGRLLTLDMTFTLFLNLGVGLGYLALTRGSGGLWLWAYLALALAVLAKGPAALVLAGLVWGSWLVFRGLTSPPLPQPSPPHPDPLPPAGGEGTKSGDGLGRLGAIARQPWKSLVQPRAWLLSALIVLPWFAYVQWRHPGFFRFFILEHHLGRYLTPAIHPEPIYYYLPVLLAMTLPWCLLLPWALTAGRRRPGDPHRAFLLIWAAVVLAFFSLSRGKLAPYILPALPPLALALGEAFSHVMGPGRLPLDRGLRITLLVWGVGGLILVALYFRPPGALARELARLGPFSSSLLAGLAAFTLAPLLALLWRQAGVLFLGALLLAAMIPAGVEAVSWQRSPRELGRLVQDRWQPGAALIGVHLYSPGLSFYSGQIFHLLDFSSELDFGRRLRPESGLFFANRRDLAALAQARPVSFFYLKADDLPDLEKEFPRNLTLLARQKDCILLCYEGK
jgi:4-amino-4-deoxy-L-arabinose transferase-like glycosyltransferase